MKLGYSPEFTTVIIRMSDSITNIITPLLLYFPMIISFAQRYDKSIEIGSLISMMIPYSVAFFISWIILLFVWMVLGIPVGTGAGIDY